MPDTLPTLTVRKSLTVEAPCAHAFGPVRTKVEFEHRHIERSVDAEQLRAGVDSPQGWTRLLQLFAARAKETAATS